METKERFIILKKTKYSEADLIIQALSTQGEKLSFIARGALKSKKRFGGGILEPSHFVQLTFKKSSEEGKLHTLNEATLLNEFKNLKKSYDHLEFALHILENIGRVSQEGDHTQSSMFNLLGNTLKAIESCEDLQVLKMHFYLKFLMQQGVLTPEPWMGPFLKFNLSETNLLLNAELNTKRDVLVNFSHIENAVHQYVRTAENH